MSLEDDDSSGRTEAEEFETSEESVDTRRNQSFAVSLKGRRLRRAASSQVKVETEQPPQVQQQEEVEGDDCYEVPEVHCTTYSSPRWSLGSSAYDEGGFNTARQGRGGNPKARYEKYGGNPGRGYGKFGGDIYGNPSGDDDNEQPGGEDNGDDRYGSSVNDGGYPIEIGDYGDVKYRKSGTVNIYKDEWYKNSASRSSGNARFVDAGADNGRWVGQSSGDSGYRNGFERYGDENEDSSFSDSAGPYRESPRSRSGIVGSKKAGSRGIPPYGRQITVVPDPAASRYSGGQDPAAARYSSGQDSVVSRHSSGSNRKTYRLGV